MYRVSKQFEFPAAHVLSKHPGRCRFPHGHNYRVQITLITDRLDGSDMVCDFQALKALLAEYLDSLDHAILLNSQDRPNREGQEDNPRRVLIENRDPTTEVLAEMIFKHLQARLRDTRTQTAKGVEYKINPAARLEKVTVWESSTAHAEYQE